MSTETNRTGVGQSEDNHNNLDQSPYFFECFKEVFEQCQAPNQNNFDEWWKCMEPKLLECCKRHGHAQENLGMSPHFPECLQEAFEQCPAQNNFDEWNSCMQPKVIDCCNRYGEPLPTF